MEQMMITEKNKYSTKDITKFVRQTLRIKFKDLKFSVTYDSYSGGSSMSINIMESSKIRFIKRKEEITELEILRLMNGRNDSREEIMNMIDARQTCKTFNVNHYHIDSDWQFTDEGKRILKEITEVANEHNWDRSDAMTDYFDVNYYVNISLGKWDKPFIDGGK